MDIVAIVNSVIGTEYSPNTQDTIVKIAEVEDDDSKSSVGANDLLNLAGDMSGVDDYELNQIEKLSASIYLMESDKDDNEYGESLARGLIMQYIAQGCLNKI